MANGSPSPGARLQPPAAPQQIQRTRTIVYHVFGVEVHELQDGGRQIDIVLPDASVVSLPMDRDMARLVGERLIAPSIEVPRAKVAMN
jgi:hypothetical protein